MPRRFLEFPWISEVPFLSVTSWKLMQIVHISGDAELRISNHGLIPFLNFSINVFSGHNRQRLGSRWVVNAVAAVECDPACRNSCYFAIIVLASIRSQKVAPKSPTESNTCLPFEIYLKVGEVGEPHQLAGQPGRIEDQKVSLII